MALSTQLPSMEELSQQIEILSEMNPQYKPGLTKKVEQMKGDYYLVDAAVVPLLNGEKTALPLSEEMVKATGRVVEELHNLELRDAAQSLDNALRSYIKNPLRMARPSAERSVA